MGVDAGILWTKRDIDVGGKKTRPGRGGRGWGEGGSGGWGLIGGRFCRREEISWDEGKMTCTVYMGEGGRAV